MLNFEEAKTILDKPKDQAAWNDAFKRIEELAKEDHVESLEFLGTHHFKKGLLGGGNEELKKALEYYSKASGLGSSTATDMLEKVKKNIE